MTDNRLSTDSLPQLQKVLQDFGIPHEKVWHTKRRLLMNVLTDLDFERNDPARPTQSGNGRQNRSAVEAGRE
ncbi:hypothetical protein [Noviherbaspirillum agri]